MLLVGVLIGSVLGIAAMVWVNARMGLFEPARLTGLEDAIARLDTDCVGFEPGQGGLVAPDGSHALVPGREGVMTGLIVARGSDFVIRYLTRGSVRSVEAAGADELILTLNDFAFAPARLKFDNSREAGHWAERLGALKG